jgi:predicted  nucleic acid-binding Zn-ribbon protein|tara:strand:- start:153 stop:623 length:471 start_codon:yes stop_codon:yes gene_type:complete
MGLAHYAKTKKAPKMNRPQAPIKQVTKINSPQAPISWGELFDKITILQIKLDNLTLKNALENVEQELKKLQSILTQYCPKEMEATQLEGELRQINQHLWDIEDKIRDKERNNSFDDEFIQLARSVYITNDERSRIKRKINDLFGSELIEEKSYAKY